MKIICVFLFVSFLGCIASGIHAQQADYLDVGSKLIDYPKVDWLKGEPVTQFDKNKIYVVDLWATWCNPCIAAMPHLSELNKKFKNKNVVFIAQDVMEDNKEKVDTFLKQKADLFTFNVAFSGPTGSDFDKKWVKAAGIASIPQTFIIQNNTLVWITSPYMLSDETLQLLVDGKFTIEAAEDIARKHQQ